jgi:bacterioferritin
LPPGGDKIKAKPEGFEIPNEQEATMKGDPKLIKALNSLLADELTAINQYMVHSEMCDNWKYEALAKVAEKRAIDEMKHAEKLIGRMLFLEGAPVVSKLNDIHIGAAVEAQHHNDAAAELTAIKAYNDAIKATGELGDFGTREVLEAILTDEEEHLDWLEAQQDQIQHMGIQVYLSNQVED